MTGLEHAILGLRQALDAPRRHRVWRWLVRQRMAGVKDELGPLVLETPDIETVRTDLLRLLSDLEHHRQNLNDLVHDSVSQELGGSE